MQAAEEDCARLAPNTEFVATGQITVEPGPHGEPLALWVLPLRQEPCRHNSFRLSPEEELGRSAGLRAVCCDCPSRPGANGTLLHCADAHGTSPHLVKLSLSVHRARNPHTRAPAERGILRTGRRCVQDGNPDRSTHISRNSVLPRSRRKSKLVAGEYLLQTI